LVLVIIDSGLPYKVVRCLAAGWIVTPIIAIIGTHMIFPESDLLGGNSSLYSQAKK
jgi:hypothetical protein